MPGTSEAVDPDTPPKISGLDGSGHGNVSADGVDRNARAKSKSSGRRSSRAVIVDLPKDATGRVERSAGLRYHPGL